MKQKKLSAKVKDESSPQDSHKQEEHSNDPSTDKDDIEEEILGKVIRTPQSSPR